MNNEGFREVHLRCTARSRSLRKLKTDLPDLRPSANCDPANVPPKTVCYEYPVGRERELEQYADVLGVAYTWGAGGVTYQACFALGDYLFAVSDAPALQIWNISNPASPSSLATLGLDNNPQAIWVTNGVCFVVDSGGLLYCIDIDDPAVPSIEPSGVAQTGENWSHLRAIGDIGVLSGPNASFVALYDLGIRPPREIQNTDTIVGSQAAFQGRRLFFGDTTGSPRAMLRNYRIGGQFCPIIHTYDLYAETQVTAELVRARHVHAAGEITCDQLTVGGGDSDTDTGSANAANYVSINGRRIIAGSGDPNGSVTARKGSIFMSDSGAVYRNTDGATAWTAM